MTVSDVRSLLNTTKYVDDIEDSVIYMWLTAIDQEAYKLLVDLFPEKYMSSSTISVVADTQEYSTPSDFGESSLSANSTGLFKVNDSNLITYAYRFTEFGSGDKGYYLDGDNVVITPKPTSAVTLTLRYIPEIDAITSDSDTLQAPDKYKDLIIEELFTKYNNREETGIAEISVSQRFSTDFRNRLIANFPQKKRRTLRLGSNVFNNILSRR